MPRSSVTPFDSQTTESISVALPKLVMGTNYAVTKDDPGESVVKNITAAVDLEEQISYKYSKLDKISTTLKGVNPQTTKEGYQIVIKDEFIQRTTEPDGVTVHDDPVIVYVTFRTTTGANIASGSDVYDVIKRAISCCVLQTGTAASTTPLDRLMRGATKPAALV